jgi:hypothetical protein
MCLDEFKNLCSDGEIFAGESMLAEREIPIAFAISMMTQVDELNQSKVFEMGFLEFLEAFSRVAEKASLYPINTPEDQVFLIFFVLNGIGRECVQVLEGEGVTFVGKNRIGDLQNCQQCDTFFVAEKDEPPYNPYV